MFEAKSTRVVIIGAGRVGSHCAMSLIPRRLVDEIVLVDINPALAEAQATDLADFACGMTSGVRVRSGTYDDCNEATFVLVAAGRGRKPGETRLELLRDTFGVLKSVSDNLSATSFDGILVCITNPVDIATEFLSRSLSLPASQVVGTGTALDTIRLKRILSERTGVGISQINGFCMGEHGDSSFVAWSHVSVGGVPLSEYAKANDPLLSSDELAKIEQQIHATGGDIISGKGCTEFGVGSVVTELVRAVTCDEKHVLPLSVHLDGQYGETGICAGTPCVVDGGGVVRVLEVELTGREQVSMTRSCAVIRKALEDSLGQ